MKLQVLHEPLTVSRFGPNTPIPPWATERKGPLFSITATHDELSIVTASSQCPPSTEQKEEGWLAFKVAGPLDFSLTGILSKLTTPLAKAGIPIFAISTFDTDYLLVKAENVPKATQVFQSEGHVVES